MTDIIMQPSTNLDRVSAPEALAMLKAELLALPRGERVHINIDVATVVTTILGSLPELRKCREELVDELRRFDVDRFDKLVLYARALYFANVCHLATSTPTVSLQELVAEATALRDVMYPDVAALANRGLIDPNEIKELKRQLGHRGPAFDLQSMAFSLERSAEKVKGKTAITEEEVKRAVFLADRLLDGVGLREQAPEQVREAAELRSAAYSVLVWLYEDIRAGVVYVRRKVGDADRIAPSLYAGRGGRPRREEEPEAAPAEAPVAPRGAVPHQAVPVMPPAQADVPVGMPGSSPFLRS